VFYGAALPFLLLFASVLDLMSDAQERRFVRCRFHVAAAAIVWWHFAGLIPLLFYWVVGLRWLGRTPTDWRERHRRIEAWWVTQELAIAEWVYGMTVEVESLEKCATGPLLLLCRHSSVIDTILPIYILSGRLQKTLRMVKQHETLWDPWVDVMARRLPRTFVRSGSDPALEIAQIEQLLGGMDERDVVCLFPEGARFTPKTREKIVCKLRQRNPELGYRAQRLKNLLPPQPASILAVLRRRPDMDVIFSAHTGLERAGRIEDIAAGALLDRVIKVRYWRVPASEVPLDDVARIQWLFSWWERLDRWVEANRGVDRG
jgi:1-acyl-sn-glycerol-3-phosphate acyltransferase